MPNVDQALAELEGLVAEQRAAAIRLDSDSVETIASSIGEKMAELGALPTAELATEDTKRRVAALRRALLHNLQLVAHARDAYRDAASVMRGERDGKIPRISVRG